MRVYQTQENLWRKELETRRSDGWQYDNKVSKMVGAFKAQKQFQKLSKTKKQFVHAEEDWFLELQAKKQYFQERTVEAVERIKECGEYIDTLHRQKRVLVGDVRKHKTRSARRPRRSNRPCPANSKR